MIVESGTQSGITFYNCHMSLSIEWPIEVEWAFTYRADSSVRL